MKIVSLILLAIASLSNAQNQFIVNGTDATIDEFPFAVSLRINNRHSCGGSIIAEFWILTAAHCVSSPASEYTVQFASTYLDPNSLNVAQVESVHPHEGYNPSNQYINDIALVRLSSPITNEISKRKVKLPTRFASFSTGTPAVLIGWGLNETWGQVLNTLQKVDLQIYSAEDCNKIHEENGGVNPTNICAGVDGGYKDSGGPLLNDAGMQVGIVSWSIKPCTTPPFPGVLTAVASYIDWIEQTAGIKLRPNTFLQA